MSRRGTQPFRLPIPPRIVVAEEIREARDRERVFRCLAALDASRVLNDVRAYLKVERGALARQARILPASVKKAAAFGVRTFETLEMVTAQAGMWAAMRDAKAGGVGALEADLLVTLQDLMDLVFAGGKAFGRDARILVAGLGGCDLVPLRRFWAHSGLEAAVNLAAEVRLAVRGLGFDPFARFPKPAEAGRLRKQVGRERPATPRETDPDDLAILRAMARGIRGKQVAGATSEFGHACSDSHVRKRRMDLGRWGWITKGRDARLTAAGERWLSESMAPE